MEEVMEQRTDMWDEARRGKFTASECHRLTTETNDPDEAVSKGAMTYIVECALEEFTGEPGPSYDGEATTWGIENEPLARHWYEKATGSTVKEVGFIEYDLFPGHAGGSPDGLVDDDGCIEIKCPKNQVIHILYMLFAGKLKKKYKAHYWQCQMNMAVTGRKWCDFISFDPRLNSSLGLIIVRIDRNEEDIAFLNEQLRIAIELKIKLVKQLSITRLD